MTVKFTVTGPPEVVIPPGDKLKEVRLGAGFGALTINKSISLDGAGVLAERFPGGVQDGRPKAPRRALRFRQHINSSLAGPQERNKSFFVS